MSDRKYWIGVAAKDHVDIAVKEDFCMFAHGKGSAAKRLSAGDWFAYYCPKTGMGEGEEVRAFTAIGQVTDEELRDRPMGEHGIGAMRNASYFGSKDADVYPLLDKLSFIKNRTHWGMYFRKSLFEISQQDMQLIAAEMGVDTNKL